MVRLHAGYDVVVVGEGLPLLASGLTLVRSGARALLIPLSESTLPYIEGVELPSLLRELGLAPAELKHVQNLGCSLQLIKPKMRLELAADDEQWLQHGEREWGQNSTEHILTLSELSHTCHEHAVKAAQTLTCFTALPPHGLKQKFRNRNAMARLWQHHKTRSHRSKSDFWPLWTRALAMMVSHAEPSAILHQGQIDQLISLARWGSFEARSLYSLLKQHLHRRGAEVLQQGSLAHIFSRRKPRKHLDCITLEGADCDTVHFDTMILATHPHRLLPYLNPQQSWKALHKWIDSQRISWDRYVLSLPLLADALPSGLQKRALLIQNPQAPLSHHNCLLLEQESLSDGQVLLWCRFVLPHGERVEAMLLQQILSHLKEVIPFLTENMLAPLPEPKLQGHLYRNPGCALFGLAPQSPYKNLLHASAANMPEWGVEGEILSGIKTAQLALVSRIHKQLGGLVLERNSISA